MDHLQSLSGMPTSLGPAPKPVAVHCGGTSTCSCGSSMRQCCKWLGAHHSKQRGAAIPCIKHTDTIWLHYACRGAHGFVQLALDMKTGEQVAIKFLERTGRKMKTKHILRCGA